MNLKFFILSLFFNFITVNSFINSKIIKKRKIILKSHFSTVSTNLKNKDFLIKSISSVTNCTISYDKQNIVRGYNGNDVLADIVIRQNNGVDIGFKIENGNYEMIADLQFWDQDIPPDFFLEKITQKYTLDLVLESCKQEGFAIDSINNNAESIINVQVSKYKI